MAKGRMSDETREKLRQAAMARHAEKKAEEPVQDPMATLQDLPGDDETAGVMEPQSDAEVAVAMAETVGPTSELGQLKEIMGLLTQAIAQAQVQNNDQLVQALEESQRRLQAHENPVPPLVSAFNPEGDRDHPRPKLRAETTQCGFPVQESACTREELELINQVIELCEAHKRENKSLPAFRVTKADGTVSTVSLDIQWDQVTDRVRRLAINYPVKTADMRSGLYSFNHMMREMLGLEAPDIDVPQLLARVRALEAENQRLASLV